MILHAINMMSNLGWVTLLLIFRSAYVDKVLGLKNTVTSFSLLQIIPVSSIDNIMVAH